MKSSDSTRDAAFFGRNDIPAILNTPESPKTMFFLDRVFRKGSIS